MVSKFRQTGASLAFLLLAAAAANAQQATITGRVTNEGGNPLASVSVLLDGMGIGTITRDDGRYSIAVPAARLNGQTVPLVARLIGYKSVSVPVTLSASAPITHDFVLVSNPLKLGEIVDHGNGNVVVGRKARQRAQPRRLDGDHAQQRVEHRRRACGEGAERRGDRVER